VSEVSLGGVVGACSALPFAEAVLSLLLPGGELAACGVLVLPAYGGAEALVVDSEGEGGADACELLLLFKVEGPPLWALVDDGVDEYGAALGADEFACLVVGDEGGGTTLVA